MRGWGACDDFQEQIEATVAERVEQSRTALQGKGSAHCIDCDALIPLARRKAMPSAVRCVRCQEEWDDV